MLIITFAANDEPDEKVLGILGCERIAPVNDYELITTNSRGELVTTTLSGYSRWTEPAFGLLARLLRLHPRDSDLRAPGARLQSTIYLGSDNATARVVERLEGHVEAGTLYVKCPDEFGTRERKGPARPAYGNPLDLLEHAARLAGWSKDAEPLVPKPLTEVPVYEGDGTPFVLERDIPAFPLRHFRNRGVEVMASRRDAYFAQDWLQFIGSKK